MTLRADHAAGGVFVAFGLVVLAMSGDLPFGTLSFPGAMIFFSLVLIVRAGESAPLASISRGDLWHAARVTTITAAAIALYRTLGFIMTMALLLFALVFGAERRNPLYAGVFSVGVVLVTYVLFTVALKTPLDRGIFGF
jgi:hypothetical protein